MQTDNSHIRLEGIEIGVYRYTGKLSAGAVMKFHSSDMVFPFPEG